MVNIICLIGRRSSGKTRTLKKFFGLGSDERIRNDEYIDKKNGKIVCAVGFGSPQELNEFCKFKDVIDNLNERIKIAKEEVKKTYKKDDFVFVIPFTLMTKIDGRNNENCILKPIEMLKNKGYDIFLIYLKRPSRNPWYDEFMESLTTYEILSREEYGEQAKELNKLISPFCT